MNRKPLRPSKAVPGYDSHRTPPPSRLIKKALSRFLQDSTKGEREREGEGEREKENGDEESARTRAIDRSPMTKRIERRLESATLVVAFKRVASSR